MSSGTPERHAQGEPIQLPPQHFQVSNTRLSEKLLRIIRLWKRYELLLSEMSRLSPDPGPGFGGALIKKLRVEDVLDFSARHSHWSAEDKSALRAKYPDDPDAMQLIEVLTDKFPPEAFARFVVAAVPLTPGDICSLIELNSQLRKSSIDRFTPLPKVVLGAIGAALLFLLKEVPQVVTEKMGIDYAEYQLVVVFGGLALVTYVGFMLFLVWRAIRGVGSDFARIDLILRLAALVAGGPLETKIPDSKAGY
jgi:hypothetical protein